MSETALMNDLAALEAQRQSLLDEQRRGDLLDQEIEQANEALAAKQQALFEVKLQAAQKQLVKRRKDEIALFDRLEKIGGELAKLAQDADKLKMAMYDLARPVRSGDPLFARGSIDIVHNLAAMATIYQAEIESRVKGHKMRRDQFKGYGGR